MTSSTRIASDFLPLGDATPAPLPRAVLYVGLGLLGTLFVWAYFAPLDIIAVAPGKIIPQGYLQIVQPTEPGVIKEILVTDGAQVKAGQVLARMDARLSDADSRQLQNELGLKRLQLRRIDAELAGAPLRRRCMATTPMAMKPPKPAWAASALPICGLSTRPTSHLATPGSASWAPSTACRPTPW